MGTVLPNQLTRQELKDDPRYESMTANTLRDEIRDQPAAEDYEEWQINISSGHVLEKAYQRWIRLGHNGKQYNCFVRDRKVKPDFVGIVKYQGELYDESDFYEVKVSINTINKEFSNNQIAGEVEAVSFQGAPPWGRTFTLVVPDGASIDVEDLIEWANSKKVSVFVSYAFFRKDNGSIMFSAPIYLNRSSIPKTDLASAFFAPGYTERGVPVDYDSWIPNFRQSNEFDEYQNGAPSE